MTAPLTHNIEEAAHILGPVASVDWLKKAVAAKKVPHVRSGNGRGRAGRVAFTDAHLAEILLLLEQRPEDSPAPDGPGEFRSVVSRGRRAS